jgi:DNA-binding NarL/FixJ family response regulator
LIRNIALPFTRDVCECGDGDDILSCYSLQRPDLVLMDIRMDEVDGIQATRQIIAADPAAKVVIVTDYDDEALREAAMAAGARGYVLKENLLELSEWLRNLEVASGG